MYGFYLLKCLGTFEFHHIEVYGACILSASWVIVPINFIGILINLPKLPFLKGEMQKLIQFSLIDERYNAILDNSRVYYVVECLILIRLT